ncbi:hypothetical protein KY362_04040, partial [Candidatus Woesearchaeota archaeon]|nr:hypothetical protein [Candidatus Woesearchaeota archaeon]
MSLEEKVHDNRRPEGTSHSGTRGKGPYRTAEEAESNIVSDVGQLLLEDMVQRQSFVVQNLWGTVSDLLGRARSAAVITGVYAVGFTALSGSATSAVLIGAGCAAYALGYLYMENCAKRIEDAVEEVAYIDLEKRLKANLPKMKGMLKRCNVETERFEGVDSQDRQVLLLDYAVISYKEMIETRKTFSPNEITLQREEYLFEQTIAASRMLNGKHLQALVDFLLERRDFRTVSTIQVWADNILYAKMVEKQAKSYLDRLIRDSWEAGQDMSVPPEDDCSLAQKLIVAAPAFIYFGHQKRIKDAMEVLHVNGAEFTPQDFEQRILRDDHAFTLYSMAEVTQKLFDLMCETGEYGKAEEAANRMMRAESAAAYEKIFEELADNKRYEEALDVFERLPPEVKRQHSLDKCWIIYLMNHHGQTDECQTEETYQP